MSATQLISKIVDQHHENAASLWLLRDAAVRGGTFHLADIVALDERIEANLDGLRIAQGSGWSTPPDALERGDAGDFFTAGLLAMERDDPDAFGAIIEQTYARTATDVDMPYHPASDPWRGLLSALAWIDRGTAVRAIEHLLDTPRPRTRWLGIAACGARRIVRHPGLEVALADQQPLVRARAARSAGQLGRTDIRAMLNAMLNDPDDECRFWAAWSAARLGTDEGLHALARFVRQPGARCNLALSIILRRLPVDRANAFLRPLAAVAEHRRTVILATGFIGDPVYLPWLLTQMTNPALARAAGDVFATITGADLSKLEGKPPDDFRSGPNDDPDDEGVAPDPDEGQAWPDPEQCRFFLEGNDSGFVKGTGYYLGAPRQVTNWSAVLLEAPQRRRAEAALEIALRQPGQAMFEVRARGAWQRRLLERVRPAQT